MYIQGEDIKHVWHRLLFNLYNMGEPLAPRGIKTHELTGVTIAVQNPLRNILTSDERNLNYRFMTAEWLWIWFGLEDAKTIGRYNSRIVQFADPVTGIFDGAYGPRISRQLPRILETLKSDSSSRQAVIQIYSPSPAGSADHPCTVSIQFMIRQNKLRTIVTMRSSDVWLGLPYDFFNFSMIANLIAYSCNVGLGSLTMHLGSSHLYDTNRPSAYTILKRADVGCVSSPRLTSLPSEDLLRTLQDGENHVHFGSEYYRYASALASKTSSGAFKCLTNG